MPTYVKGDMWEIFNETDWFLITTNPNVKANGEAVMGAGIAKQAADRFPELARDFGNKLGTISDAFEHPVSTIGRYGPLGTRIGWFMTKANWKRPSNLNLIQESAYTLSDILHAADLYGAGIKRVDLNFPGIGCGGLKRESVLPLLQFLPSKVHIWEYDNN